MGVVVFIFQDGHGSQLWDVGATGSIIAYVPVMIFAFLYGISMDFEVFMLSRMREAYDETGSTDRAIELGLARTAKLVTSSALILMFAFIVLSTGPGLRDQVARRRRRRRHHLRRHRHPRTARAGADEAVRRANWWSPPWLDRLLPTPTPAGGSTPRVIDVSDALPSQRDQSARSRRQRHDEAQVGSMMRTNRLARPLMSAAGPR
jgi:RND superfamily putative drug exporter